MERLGLWYRQTREAFLDSTNVRCFLLGGFWSNESDKSWDIDVFVVPIGNDEGDPYPSMEKGRLLRLHNLMRDGTALAINRYRFLVDITATTEAHLEEVARQYRLFEKGKLDRVTFLGKMQIDTGYGIHKYITKNINGVKLFERTVRIANVIELCDGKCFYKKVFSELSKQSSYIRQGRIYYDPVRLDDVFGIES